MEKVLKNFVSESPIKLELNNARVKDSFIYATDGFKAIKIDIGYLPVEFQPLCASSEKVVPIDNLYAKGLKDMNYPDVDKVIRDTKDDRCIKIDFVFLEQLCNSLKRLKKLTKDTGFNHVNMYIGKSDYEPLVFKTKQATALIMPCNK